MRTIGLFEILLIAFVVLLLFGGARIPRMASALGRRVRSTADQAKWVYESMGGSDEAEIEAERKVGAKLAAEFRQQMPPDADQSAVARIGRRLSETAMAKGRTFEFQVVDAPTANAYSLPGGYVFITRQMLDLCANDDEVAFVLAHEMGHIVAKHFIGKYTMDFLLSRISAGQLIGKLLGTSYSREQEHEADSKGAAIAAEAKFSRDGATRFLRRLESLPREASVLSSYLSTHPEPGDRIAQLRA